MGARGPAPKPTNLRILDGTARQHPERVNAREPDPAPADTSPPKWLKGKEERRVYTLVASRLAAMHLLTEADEMAVAQLAIYWVKWKALAEEASTEVWTTDTGYTSTDPRINSMVKLGEKVTALLKEFGMTPSARTRISVPEQAPADPMEGFLNDASSR